MISSPGFVADTIEIASAALIGLGAFLFFRHKGNTMAEAGAYGLLGMLMLHSWLAQALLLAGLQELFTPFRFLLLAPAAFTIGCRRRLLADQFAAGHQFARAHREAVLSISLAWCYISAVWIWGDGYAASPGIALWANMPNDGFFTDTGPARQAIPVLNHLIFLAPWQSSAASGTANLAAYMIVALGTYALARRYAWPPTAVTVALLVISMPRLAYQSLAPYSELIPAAAVLVAILALYRALEQSLAHDAAMLICAVAFAVSGGRLCYAMPAVLAGLSLLVLGRRYDIRLWPQAIKRHPLAIVAVTGMVLVFSQVLIVGANLSAGQSWIGEVPPDIILLQKDGLGGAAANMARYILQSVHFPELFDSFTRWAFGFSGLSGLKLFYQSAVEPLAGGKGAAALFELSWDAENGGGWFGPVGFLFVMPSLLHAFLSGPHRLKTTALALWCYWVLIALTVAWQPSAVRLMTPFFVGAGFTMAFFMTPWRLGRRRRLILQLFGIAMLAGDMLGRHL
jgi:hypothetical protein